MHDHDQAEPRGELLATLRRGRGEELRVELAEYEGHPYVGLRVWAPGQDGRLLPVRGNGCSVRGWELRDVAAALERTARILDGQDRLPAAHREFCAIRPCKNPTAARGAEGTGAAPRPGGRLAAGLAHQRLRRFHLIHPSHPGRRAGSLPAPSARLTRYRGGPGRRGPAGGHGHTESESDE